MALTRSMVLLLTYAALAAATMRPSEQRAQAVKAPSVPHLAGDQEAEAGFTGVAVFIPAPPPLPALPPLPGFPGMVGAQSSPSPSQQPASCLGALGRVITCAPYLIDSVPAPPSTCCDGFRSLVGSSARICLCHAIIGNLSTLAGGTIDQLRLLVLPLTCSTFVPPDLLLMCIREFETSLSVLLYIHCKRFICTYYVSTYEINCLAVSPVPPIMPQH